MSGRILIADPIATNRVVLRAKIRAAHYEVESCASYDEVRAIMADDPPDLLIINLADCAEDPKGLCRDLRLDPETRHLPVLSFGGPDTPSARFAALDAGADDVITPPISDTLLLSRIRSLLRQRSVLQELDIRDGTRRALGFEERRAAFLRPPSITILSDRPRGGAALRAQIVPGLPGQIRLMTPPMMQALGARQPAADVIVLDGTAFGHGEAQLYQSIADLGTRPWTRTSAMIVIVPDGRPDMAAMALDLGALDAVEAGLSDPELQHRLRRLIDLHNRIQTMRDSIRIGLDAAVTDPLTGLYNRRYAEGQLHHMAEDATAIGLPYALLALDIDHFKTVNDRYGHTAGDDVLKDLATRLKSGLRDVDLLARLGGEEFLIALPATDCDLALRTGDRLCNLVRQRPFPILGGTTSIPLTVSIGIAVDHLEPEGAMPPKTLFEQADAALFRAKSAGRNTSVMSELAA